MTYLGGADMAGTEEEYLQTAAKKHSYILKFYCDIIHTHGPPDLFTPNENEAEVKYR